MRGSRLSVMTCLLGYFNSCNNSVNEAYVCFKKTKNKHLVQSNLDYPDLDYPDYSIIPTFLSGPNFFMNIN